MGESLDLLYYFRQIYPDYFNEIDFMQQEKSKVDFFQLLN
jgi:hypothetical protein